MKKTLKRLMIVVPCLVLVGLGFIYLAPDYNLYKVRSGSMEPAIHVGDLIITGPIDGPLSSDVTPGTVITYEHKNETVTHRIHSIDGAVITTKGDAVEDPDPWTVEVSSIRGVYMFKIPFVGYLTNFIQTKTGWFVTILLPAMLLVLWLVKDIVKEALKDEKKANPIEGGEAIEHQ